MPADLVLNYPTRSTGRASLEEFDGGVRFTFPALPVWARVVSIVSCCLMATSQTVQSVIVVCLWWHFRGYVSVSGKPLPTPGSRELFEVIFPFVLAGCYWIGCVFVIKNMQKQTRNPETWSVTPSDLTIWRHRMFGLRRRNYPASEIKSVEMIPVADIFRREGIFLLVIRLDCGRRRIGRRLSGETALVAAQAVVAFRKMLNLSGENIS